MNSNNNNGWSQAGSIKRNKNKLRRQRKKQELKIQQKKEEKQLKKIAEEQQNYRQREEEWRRKRIELIKEQTFEEFKSRKITTEFAKAIQRERAKAKLTRQKLALQLMISENELGEYENGKKCPTSQTVVKLRTIFDNLPRKYFTFN